MAIFETRDTAHPATPHQQLRGHFEEDIEIDVETLSTSRCQGMQSRSGRYDTENPISCGKLQKHKHIRARVLIKSQTRLGDVYTVKKINSWIGGYA